jgi:hypothetical protein
MTDISSCVNFIKMLLEDLIVMKKEAIFSDRQISNDVF